MTLDAQLHALLRRIERDEAPLALRAAAGDRDAFDALFDRYCARLAHAFRTLPEVEAKAKIWEALEQIFAGLGADGATPLAIRAFRVSKASSTERSPCGIRTPGRRRMASRHDR